MTISESLSVAGKLVGVEVKGKQHCRSHHVRTHRKWSAAQLKLVRMAARVVLGAICGSLGVPGLSHAQTDDPMSGKVTQIISSPLYRHSRWGVEFYSLDEKRILFSRNEDDFFYPASTAKLLTIGTAFALLGADYRFHTRVYRTGPIDTGGILKGNIVLVASGDPNLDSRIQPDDTLAFENEDHTYAVAPGAAAVPGDPMVVFKQIANQVAQHGITRITGRVMIDVNLFPEGAQESGMVVSPIVVNDNVIDVVVRPGPEGSPAILKISPQTSYVHFINRTTTVLPGAKDTFHWADDTVDARGTHVVTVVGDVPQGEEPTLHIYGVPEPSEFAAIALTECLREKGIAVDAGIQRHRANSKRLAISYSADTLVAEHVSPPLSETGKVILKVSQNLHAHMMPYILGAVVDGNHDTSEQAGFDLEHDWLTRAGLDLSAASQGSGAGGTSYFTTDFVIKYLVYLTNQPFYPRFVNCLPIMGRDGTLAAIQRSSPAAGHVFAKTGTAIEPNLLDRNFVLDGKGLAGYLTTRKGHKLAFAIYANAMIMSDDEAAVSVLGESLGEIATEAYEVY
jgi:PBP4 family serine-type D-alanyl-D-alanine carboxypeptidase